MTQFAAVVVSVVVVVAVASMMMMMMMMMMMQIDDGVTIMINRLGSLAVYHSLPEDNLIRDLLLLLLRRRLDQ
jgi:hypothetical protein